MTPGDSIHWGIHLGTQYSSIATVRNGRPFVLTNSLGEELTPTAVALRQNREVFEVGRRARQLLGVVPMDVAVEFREMVGQPEWKHKFSTGAEMSAGELMSLVIAKLLKGISLRGLPRCEAAVIGVPAHFTNPQYDDLTNAAHRAGIGYVELSPEAIAIAQAFAEHADVSGRRLWLIYDLGESSLETTLLRVQDGVFTLLDDQGERACSERYLTGTIISQLIRPKLPYAIQAKIEPWKSMYWWRLKLVVEEAQKLLSEEPDALVEANLGDFDVSLWLTQSEVNDVQARLFAPGLEMCRSLLKRNNCQPSEIERVLLVRRPTLSAFLPDFVKGGWRAADGQPVAEGLGIPCDTLVDPMTAVVRGLALHAETRRIPAATRLAATDGENTRGSGEAISVVSILPRNIGIVDQNGAARWVFYRGDALPCRHSIDFRPTEDWPLRHRGSLLTFDVIEGEHPSADLNELIYQFAVGPVPALQHPTDICLTFDIDELRQIKVHATGSSGDEYKCEYRMSTCDREATQTRLQSTMQDLEGFRSLRDKLAAFVAAIDEVAREQAIERVAALLQQNNLESFSQAEELLLTVRRRLYDCHQRAKTIVQALGRSSNT